jgi:hypothetical protein
MATAASSAVNSPFSNNALVNQPVSEQEGTLWPGAIGPTEHNVGGYADHSATVQGLPGRPSPPTPFDHNPFLGELPADDNAGDGYNETGLFYQEHDVLAESWDANAGNTYGPAAIAPLHEYGVGASPKFFDQPGNHGNPRDLVIDNQSYAPAWEWDSSTGRRDNVATPRVARDQVWDYNQNDYDYVTNGRLADVQLNPIYNNLAMGGQPVNNAGTVYSISGDLQDASQYFDNQSVVYSTPPLPNVRQLPASTYGTTEGIDGVL